MPKNGFVQARVDENLKINIEHLFEQLGLSMTDALTLFFKQCIIHNGLPFYIRLPKNNTAEFITMDTHTTTGIQEFQEFQENDAHSA